MRITVRAKPNAKKDSVARDQDGSYAVRVKAPPTDGRANLAVVAVIAAHFGVPRSRVRLVRGHTAKIKILDIFFP